MPDTQSKPKLVAPPGTCDTHMHFYDRRFPTAPTAQITPPHASVADYRALCRRLGIERTVVVQPTTYGRDNRCTLEAIAALGDAARGVAVVDAATRDAEMERLTKGGIRGARFHQLPGGALSWDDLEATSAHIQAFGWHTQLQFDGRDFLQREAAVKRVPGTLVIDHTGKFLEPVKPDDAAFKALLKLLDNGRTYVKLSAPYEVSKVGPPHYDDVGILAQALVRAAPERMLWATNWPHPSAAADSKPEDAMLMDVLLDWIPDQATRRMVLVDNPAQLYGF